MDRFLKSGIMAVATLAVATLVPQPTMAQQYTTRTQHFEAEIVNLRRNAAGQVLVTVIFRSRVDAPQILVINSNADDCDGAGRLTDGNGEDYPTTNCINFLQSRGSSNFHQGRNGVQLAQWGGVRSRMSKPGIQIDGMNEASFVFRFETPLPTDEAANRDINISIPILYQANNGDSWFTSDEQERNVTLSFYGMQIPYSATRR